MLKHRFTVVGTNAQAIWDWLDVDNVRHREWLLPSAPVGERFVFYLHENPQNPEAARRTRGHIAHLKLTGARVPDLQWREPAQV